MLKNEQGQFQLLRIGPAPSGTHITPANLTATSATNQTIRLQTVPAVSRFTGPPLALRKTIVTTQQVKQKQNVITTESTTVGWPVFIQYSIYLYSVFFLSVFLADPAFGYCFTFVLWFVCFCHFLF